MMTPWIAALLTLFAWWFSTGVILWAVKRADRIGEGAHLRTTLWCLPILGLGAYGLYATSALSTVAGVSGAFLSALAVWGWIELAFLCGVITGPNVRPCPAGIAPWERFMRAWGTIAHSEALLVVTLLAITALCWNAPNTIGMWTFITLFLARISAKLNVYLGVPKINVEFLPSPVRHLASHFRVGPISWFFPVSITALSLAFACWLERAVTQDAGSASLIGFTILAALTALALIEHWLMALPVPDAKLWRWMIPDAAPKPTQTKQHDNTATP